MASLLAHGCLLLLIGVLFDTEWIHAPRSSFAWKVQLIQPPPVQHPQKTPAPKQVKRTVEAAPPIQPLAQVKRGTKHKLRERKTIVTTRGPGQAESFRPHPLPTFSAQPTASQPTVVPTPLPSHKQMPQNSPDFLASLPNHSTSNQSQQQTYPDTTRSQPITTGGQRSRKEGLRHSVHRNRDFAVNGQKAIAPEAKAQFLHRAPVRAPQPQKEDFSWLTAAVNKKVQELKRYPPRAKLRNMEGQVVLRATIKRSGTLGALVLESPSGHHLLDQDALATVKRAFPIDMPYYFSRPQIVLLLPITYTLKAS